MDSAINKSTRPSKTNQSSEGSNHRPEEIDELPEQLQCSRIWKASGSSRWQIVDPIVTIKAIRTDKLAPVPQAFKADLRQLWREASSEMPDRNDDNSKPATTVQSTASSNNVIIVATEPDESWLIVGMFDMHKNRVINASSDDDEPCTSGCNDPKPLLLWAPRKANMYKSFKFDTPPKARRRLVFTQELKSTKVNDSDKITATPQLQRKRAYERLRTNEMENNNAKRSRQESKEATPAKQETKVTTDGDGQTSEDDCDQS
ncbi:hypothetical protein T4D_15355 [Trichinella pseudospiralis]|uniref:Uncharacterized protein n=1 Tax=Trichinella pseudospiralis TaxID=6337 RepID=A0A0V1G2P5_TRIPS|nr:hypothetical protein T4D_15355 [Trichinella pseudospiralis]